VKFKIALAVLIIGFFGLIIFSRSNNNGSTSTQQKNTFSDLIGKPAPDFQLSAYDGSTVSLNSLKGKTTILFFNEGIVCYPACWNQVAALGTDKDLNNDKVTTLSIVPDQQGEWASAIQRQPDLGKETLLIDSGLKMSQDYGVLNLESSMHKGVKPGHTYVIIDKNSIVRYTYDDPTMGIQNPMMKKEINTL
jgi:peroxiredoxin Q/BCP